MAAPLSMGLRLRVVDAVDTQGMSRRAAAARFGMFHKHALTNDEEMHACSDGSQD